ncbi:MerR family transcriptional regulator [Fusibacter sp. JL216-2]|uniref:MerR family transcriptional regulator n=1 Tax=Fusibacter sp. JL216-2 TaxID=3071453 RepID=UPI003D34AE22
MYSIGLFSKMNRITTKTLRHYDEIGLLKPAHVDDFTGYRYYSSDQLVRLNQIITLKQMGIGLSDIGKILEHPEGVEVLLSIKENDLLKRIEEQKKMLKSVQNYMKRIKGELTMKYTPVVRSLPDVIVASMRLIAPDYDYYFEIIPKMGDEMRKQGAVCAEPEYCFNIYHDGEYKEKDIDVEVCEAVVDYCEDTELIKFKKIKGYKEALCVLHKGPYSTLPDAYNFAFEWVKDNGYEVVGLPRESYIDGIWNKDSDEEWLTEIQIPIGK